MIKEKTCSCCNGTGKVITVEDYDPTFGDNNTSKPNSGMFESCVICHVVTTILKSTHIDMRLNYVDGVGQLCRSCAAAG